MPRDSSGNVTLVAGNPVAVGTTIDASWANDTMNDFVTMMQDSLSRSGDGGMLVAFENTSGLVGAPGMTWVSEPTSGFYLAATNDMRASIAGSDRARFRADATQPFQIWSGAAWVDALDLSTQTIVKTSDETVNNSNSPQEDDDLQGFVIAAATRYRFEIYLRVVSGSNSTDMVVDIGLTQASVSGVKTLLVSDGAPATWYGSTVDSVEATQYADVSTNVCSIQITGFFLSHATTAGTAALWWAQNAAFAFDTTIKAGSYMKIEALN